MISSEDIVGLIVGSFCSIAAPIVALLICRVHARLTAGDVALGVAAAVASQAIFGMMPSWDILFDFWLRPTPAGWLIWLLAQNVWIVVLHQALRYVFLSFLTSAAPDDGPGLAFGVGFGGFYCLNFFQSGLSALTTALKLNELGAASVFGPNTHLTSNFLDDFFWSGVPLGSRAAANLLVEIGLSVLVWRACRKKSLGLVGLALVLDLVWRLPLAFIQAIPLPSAIYYQTVGLVVVLLLLSRGAIERRWPESLRFFSDARRPQSALADAEKAPGLFAVWRDQSPRSQRGSAETSD
jgi:uncharacterized membrane protein YhfC